MARRMRTRRQATLVPEGTSTSGEYSIIPSPEYMFGVWLSPARADHMDIYESTRVSQWKTVYVKLVPTYQNPGKETGRLIP
jgi:hypothetical protein